jgi:hypothetical protein
MPIIEYWKSDTLTGFPNYSVGNQGPEDTEVLVARDSHTSIVMLKT